MAESAISMESEQSERPGGAHTALSTPECILKLTCSEKLRSELPMKIEVLYFDGCPNYRPAVDRLKSVLSREGLQAEISEIEVTDESAAAALGFFGSPTIRVDGLDVEADSRTFGKTGFACRRYSDGMPSEEAIRGSLREARGNKS